MTRPTRGTVGFALSSATSATRSTVSSRSSMPSFVRADTATSGVSPPYSSIVHAVLGELRLHLIGIRVGLVDLVERDDDRDARRP